MYVCLWNKIQGKIMETHTNVVTREECAKKCHNHAECVNFDHYPATKQCWLSKTPWHQYGPGGAHGRWTCEKKGGK